MEGNYFGKSFFIKPSIKGVKDYEDLISRDYDISISKWMHEGWEVFRKDAGTCIAFAVLGCIALILVNFIPFAGVFVSAPFVAGFIIISLMSFQNQRPEFKNYFWGFRHFLPLLLFTIVSSVFITIGVVAFVVPGIYLSVAYLFAPSLIIEKNLDFWPSMEISRKKVNKQFFGLLCFFFLLLLINLLGCIPMGLGLFITVPLSACITTAAYRDIFMQGLEMPEGDVQKTEELT